ncbi:MAG: FadR/GntR family transcriptional regulator [Chitinophagales bacterium]
MRMYKEIKKRSLPEEVANQIQNLIRKGHFKANDQLPPERELAEILNVNRSTIREALRILEVMRVVDIRQGEGAFINVRESMSIESIVFQFMFEDGLDLESLRDVFEAVIYIEIAMIKLATHRASPEEVQELVDFNMREVTDGFAEWDKEFHLLIGRLAHSSVLHRIANTYWIILERYAGALHEKPGNYELAWQHHCQLADFIINGQHEEAAQLMEEHLLWARNEVFPNFKDPFPYK